MSTVRIPVQTLQAFADQLLLAMGCLPEAAEKIARSLVLSDSRGYNTHGTALLPMYAKMLGDGAIKLKAKITVRHKTDCIISVDGHHAFGQLVGEVATRAGIEAAQLTGLACVAVCNASHLGRLGEWAEQAAEVGLVFTAFCNSGGGALNVAAFGGHQRKLSTNPIAFGLPTFRALPFNIIVDFATSQVSGAVIMQHLQSGEALHPDWTTTASGEALTNAQAFMDGAGAMLPLGGRSTGHKGYALAIVAELLGGMAGGLVAGQPQASWFSNAALFHFLDPLHLQTTTEIKQRIKALAAHLDEETVRLPGQGAHERAAQSAQLGIEMPGYVLQSLAKLADELGVQAGNNLRDLIA